MNTMYSIDYICGATWKSVITNGLVFFTSQITFKRLIIDEYVTCVTWCWATLVDVIAQIFSQRKKVKEWKKSEKKWNFTPTPNPYHHQMCNLALIQNQHAPPNVESRSYSKSICTTCQDSNQGLSACKLSVQTTTPPVLDTILIEQQAIILPK